MRPRLARCRGTRPEYTAASSRPPSKSRGCRTPRSRPRRSRQLSILLLSHLQRLGHTVHELRVVSKRAHLELVEEPQRRAKQALVHLFRRIGVYDADAAAADERVSTVDLAPLNRCQQPFLLGTNRLASGLYYRAGARLSSYEKLHLTAS